MWIFSTFDVKTSLTRFLSKKNGLKKRYDHFKVAGLSGHLEALII